MPAVTWDDLVTQPGGGEGWWGLQTKTYGADLVQLSSVYSNTWCFGLVVDAHWHMYTDMYIVAGAVRLLRLILIAACRLYRTAPLSQQCANHETAAYVTFWMPLNFFRFFKPIDLKISEVKNWIFMIYCIFLAFSIDNYSLRVLYK